MLSVIDTENKVRETNLKSASSLLSAQSGVPSHWESAEIHRSPSAHLNWSSLHGAAGIPTSKVYCVLSQMSVQPGQCQVPDALGVGKKNKANVTVWLQIETPSTLNPHEQNYRWTLTSSISLITNFQLFISLITDFSTNLSMLVYITL